MAKSPDFDYIVRAYKDKYGIDLSHMKMKWSKHPVYNNGKRSYELDDDETGGSWCRDGAVRINPNMRPVMNRFGVGGTVNDFRRRLIAHELAHEVWHNQANQDRIKKLIRDSLRQARKEKFTTPYLDTYSPDTPKKKFDSELFAEWMSDQLNKKAESPEDIAADMHKRIRYGIRYSDGTYETSPKMWEKRDANDIVVQTPEELYESNIGMCHDVTRALIKKLREKRIKHVAMMLTGDRMPNLPTHSFVVYGKNGKHTVLDPLSYATGSKGEYGSVREAVKDRIEDWKKEEEKGNIRSYRIPKKDWENRGLLDFLHFNGEKKAQAYDSKKWPDYEEYLKKHPDKKIELAEKLIREHYAKQHKWGAKNDKGKFLSGGQVNNENRDTVVVRGGDSILRQRRGTCHDLASARMKMLKDHGIDARRMFTFYGVGQDNDGVLGHSFVFFKGDDGKWHFASPHMHEKKRAGRNFGVFDNIQEAVDQYVSVAKSPRWGGDLTDDDYFEIHDATGIDIPESMPFKDFLHAALKRKTMYKQMGKYAEDGTKSLHRFTVGDQGVYEYVKNRVGKDEWKKLKDSDAFSWLPVPDVNYGAHESWFTDKGSEKFKKNTLSILEKLVDDEISESTKNESGKALYEDEYQKVFPKYEPPWTIDQIRKNFGDKIADRLAKDPVHKWRSDTGIELVHKEPTKEELLRIIENWRLMDALKKRRSNRKSKELFGMTNLQHAKELLGQ